MDGKTINDLVGGIVGTTEEIKKELSQELAKFRNIMNKGATEVKKLAKMKGNTKIKQKEVKKIYRNAMKDDKKRLLLKVQLLALKELNNRLI